MFRLIAEKNIIEKGIIFNNKEYIENKRNNKYALAAYLVSTLLIALILMVILSVYFASTKDVNFIDLINAIQTPSDDENITKLSELILSYTNFISVLIATIAVIYFLRFYILKDTLHFKNNKIKMTIFTLISFLIFYSLCILITDLVERLADNPISANQDAVVSMVKATPIVSFFAVVIIGPIIEELIFRKTIFNIISDEKKAFLVSVIIFALLHLSGDNGNFINTLLISSTYILPSILFGIIYIKSEQNIFPVIVIHILNNLLAYIAIFR